MSSAWSIRSFRFFTYAGVLLPFAAQTQSMIIGWQVYELKHDPLFLGLIGLTEAVPALSLALLAGYIVDHFNPLQIYRNVTWLALFSAGLLLFAANPWLALGPTAQLAIIYFAAFLAGVGRGFRMPASTALVPKLVPRDVLHISSAWTTSGFAMASATGPVLGGFLYAWKGALAPYGMNLAFLAAAIACLAQVQIQHCRTDTARATSVLQNVVAGLRYVFGHEFLLAAMTLDMFAMFFGGAVAMLPIFAAEILHVGPTGLGVLRSAPSLGAIVGGLLLIRRPIDRRAGKILLATVAGFGVCMIGFGLSTSFGLSLALLALAGAFDSVSMVIRSAIVQLAAPPEMRGRVGAVNSIFIGISNQLGEFESGVAAKLLGTSPSVVAGGALVFLVVAATALKVPRLKSMELSKL